MVDYIYYIVLYEFMVLIETYFMDNDVNVLG